MTLVVLSNAKNLGEITLADGKLTGSGPGAQAIADAAVRRAGGDAAKAYQALDGYCSGYVTIIVSPAEQDAAIRAAAWEEALHPRDLFGRFGHKGGGRKVPIRKAVPGGSPAQGLAKSIDEEASRAELAGDATITLHLMRAARVIRTGGGGTSWRGSASAFLQDAAVAAEGKGDLQHAADAKRYRKMAHEVSMLPDEAPSSAAVAAFMAKAAPVLPQLVGGGHETWNGKVEVFAPDEHPGIAGYIDGPIHLLNREAAAISTALEGNQATDPDAFGVMLHEMLHGVQGGRADAAAKEWDALPPGDRHIVTALGQMDLVNPTGGETSTAHTLQELQRRDRTITQEKIDALVAAKILTDTGTTTSTYNPATGKSTPPVKSWLLSAKGREVSPYWRETAKDNDVAYQDPVNAKIEEGFNELGTITHLAEFSRKMGIGDKQTSVLAVDGGKAAGNPEWARQQQRLKTSIEQARDALRQEQQGPVNTAAWQQAIDKLTIAIGQLVGHDDTTPTWNAMNMVRQLGTPGSAAQAASIEAEIHKLEGISLSRHATLAEEADRIADPARIAAGNAWGHYPFETASALAWAQAVARAEHKRGMQHKGTAGWARVLELADEINREGAAGKPIVMARQAMRAAGQDPDMANGWRLIVLTTQLRNSWPKGGRQAFADMRKLVQPDTPMAAAAGSAEGPGLSTTSAGKEAAQIMTWAWQDPAGRAAQAITRVDALAATVTSAQALREVQDAGRMLAKLAATVR